MKRNSILILSFLFMFAAVTSYRLGHYVFLRDYKVFAHVPCDPQNNVCYIQTVSDGDPQDPYKIIVIDANHAPACLFENNCDSFLCNPSEACVEVQCTAENLEEGQSCSTGNTGNT